MDKPKPTGLIGMLDLGLSNLLADTQASLASVLDPRPALSPEAQAALEAATLDAVTRVAAAIERGEFDAAQATWDAAVAAARPYLTDVQASGLEGLFNAVVIVRRKRLDPDVPPKALRAAQRSAMQVAARYRARFCTTDAARAALAKSERACAEAIASVRKARHVCPDMG